MPRFAKKQISRGQTLAERLKKTRLEKGLTLSEVATRTKISLKYLEVLEAGHYQSLPGEMYAKAWLKIYAKLLDLPIKEILVAYKIEKAISKRIKNLDPEPKDKKFFKSHFLNPRFFKFGGMGLVILALLFYLVWEINNIIAPPQVTILEPPNNFKTVASSILIIGQTEPEVTLAINNEVVLLDKNGHFSQAINLIVGLNNLEISAKKKHSRINNLAWKILRENQDNNLINN
jgi:transcriptional regulator with XRE-family HTH domain